MSNATEYKRKSAAKGAITYTKVDEDIRQTPRKVVLTVPLLHIKAKSRKYPGRDVTRGYYVNIPKSTVESMDLSEKELVQVILTKVR